MSAFPSLRFSLLSCPKKYQTENTFHGCRNSTITLLTCYSIFRTIRLITTLPHYIHHNTTLSTLTSRTEPPPLATTPPPAACMVCGSLPADVEDQLWRLQELLGDVPDRIVFTLRRGHGPLLLKDQSPLPEAARWRNRDNSGLLRRLNSKTT